LPRHTFTAPRLWAALRRLRAGASIKSAWETLRLPLTLDTLYHLVQRLRRNLTAVRSALFRLAPPPLCDVTDPLRQTIAHLRDAFPSSACPVSAFHLRFQRSLMG